jgi:ubiquitin C-terminal hydrolase
LCRYTLECHACGKASTSYDPFWDLSLPLRAARAGGGSGRLEGGSGGGGGGMGGLLRYMSGSGSSSSFSGSSGGKIGVLDCLKAFTEDEVLDGCDTFACPRCKAKGAATKRLRVRRWPRWGWTS